MYMSLEGVLWVYLGRLYGIGLGVWFKGTNGFDDSVKTTLV